MLIPIVVVVVVVLGAVSLLATAHSRAATGNLSRETRRADASAPAPGATPAAPEPGTAVEHVDEDARARGDQARRAAEGGSLVPASGTGVVRYEPVDEEELGVTRRMFFNRGILTGLALGVGGFGASALAFLWPSGAGGFGGKINVGSIDDIQKTIATKTPYYSAAAKTYIQPYPTTKAVIKKAEAVYLPQVVAGMKQGYVALYQKCPHLGCRVPWCPTSQWFECPCHGSKYNRDGEKKGGPAPRGMDRFALSVTGGSIEVDTSTVFQGPAIGTDTTGQGQEGAPCV